MTRPGEDDRGAIDRAFAEMVAGYHLTAERADGPVEEAERPAERLADPGGPTTTSEGAAEATRSREPDVARANEHWADEHPLFRFPDEPAADPSPAEPAEPAEPRYTPEPLPPLPPPAVPALLGWVGIGWAALVVLGAAFGARFPGWVGWVAVLGFVGGFAILVTRLPRHRPPDAGDGAVL